MDGCVQCLRMVVMTTSQRQQETLKGLPNRRGVWSNDNLYIGLTTLPNFQVEKGTERQVQIKKHIYMDVFTRKRKMGFTV